MGASCLFPAKYEPERKDAHEDGCYFELLASLTINAWQLVMEPYVRNGMSGPTCRTLQPASGRNADEYLL
jgi:hypothetical protein